MEEYLRGVLNDFPEVITETPKIPCEAKVFNVKDNSLFTRHRHRHFITHCHSYYSLGSDEGIIHRQQ